MPGLPDNPTPPKYRQRYKDPTQGMTPVYKSRRNSALQNLWEKNNFVYNSASSSQVYPFWINCRSCTGLDNKSFDVPLSIVHKLIAERKDSLNQQPGVTLTNKYLAMVKRYITDQRYVNYVQLKYLKNFTQTLAGKKIIPIDPLRTYGANDLDTFLPWLNNFSAAAAVNLQEIIEPKIANIPNSGHDKIVEQVRKSIESSAPELPKAEETAQEKEIKIEQAAEMLIEPPKQETKQQKPASRPEPEIRKQFLAQIKTIVGEDQVLAKKYLEYENSGAHKSRANVQKYLQGLIDG